MPRPAFTWEERVVRFKSRLAPSNERGCINWTGCDNGHGYGTLARGDGRLIEAHRFAWIAEFGELQPGICVLHKCDNRRCCNTVHLFLGTRGDNNQDCKIKGRNQHGVKHWKSKLTEAQVALIKCIPFKYGQGLEIARIFDVADSIIAQIRKFKRWTHVPLTAIAQVAADRFVERHLKNYNPYKNQHLHFIK